MKTWSTAATQVLFSLGLGGNQLNSSNTNEFHYNTLCHTVIVSILNSLASILSGTVVFAILGFLAKQSGVGIDEVATGNMNSTFFFLNYYLIHEIRTTKISWITKYFFNQISAVSLLFAEKINS